MGDPNRPPAWRRYLRFWGANQSADIDEELEFHIASRAEELVQEGRDAAAARQEALREFGDYGAMRRQVRDIDHAQARWQRLAGILERMKADLRYAVRSLRRSPGFSAVVVLTLMLGIGLNSTMFSLVNAYLFRPLELPVAERLVVMGNTSPLLRQPHEMAYRDLQAYRDLRDVFEDLAGFIPVTESLDANDRTERVWLERTTGNYLTMLRVPMALGRAYSADASARGERVVVLSHEFWQRRYHGDSAILGRTVRLDGTAHVIIGVAHASYRGLAPMIRSDGWAPMDETPAATRRLMEGHDNSFNVVGVLRGGVSIERAREAALAQARRLEERYPETNREVVPVIVPETRARPVLAVAGPVPRIGVVLLGLTLMVLAVACANVASLILARGTARRRELAVRAALGASRWRLTRAALLEAGCLAFVGALGAFALARWSTDKLASLDVATDAPLFFDYSPDWRVFGFTLGAALVATVLTGLVPAWRNAGIAPNAVLAGGRATTDRQRLRSVIVVAQLTASVVVLIAAGLFARSMQAARDMDLGITTKNLLLAQFDLSLADYDSTRARTYQREILQRARGLPGVTSATLAARIPFGYSNGSLRVVPDGDRTDRPEGWQIFMNIVSTDYFRTAGPPIIAGREFSELDTQETQRVAVVNRAMADQLWPGQDPVARTFRMLSDDTVEVRVVGVAAASQWMFLAENPRPFFWLPLGQFRRSSAFLYVATASDPAAMIPAVRQMARDLDPQVPLFELRSMDEHLRNGRAMFAVRLGAQFGASFALLAMVLAGVGLYGLVAFSVSHRTREIGIRIAVGATTGSVIRLVLSLGVRLAVIGVGLGVLAAFVATRAMAALLYGVNASDPLTFVASSLLLAGVAVMASLIPARRAARMNPVQALRSD